MITADMKPPRPQSLSLAVQPNTFLNVYDPCPAGIISPNILTKFNPSATLFFSATWHSFLFSLISFSFPKARIVLNVKINIPFGVFDFLFVEDYLSDDGDQTGQ